MSNLSPRVIGNDSRCWHRGIIQIGIMEGDVEGVVKVCWSPSPSLVQNHSLFESETQTLEPVHNWRDFDYNKHCSPVMRKVIL